MRDLANERAEVCRKLRESNLEPVAAEEMMPDGAGAWDRLKDEIHSCDLFVLILGESYGWIPPSGPMAAAGKSVTALETDLARAAGIPVLVFVKRLDSSAPTRTDDARRRDAFREEVAAWDGGWLRTEFDLARDLADKVGHAVVGLIADRFRMAQLQERRSARAEPTMPPAQAVRVSPPPADLVAAIRDRSAVLLLGAGASLEAGMPSAAAFLDAMVDRIQEFDSGYSPARSGTAFNAVASDFELLLGAAELRKLAKGLVDPPYAAEPTAAHLIAGRLFDTVVTTNYDLLLERAIRSQGRDPQVIAGEATPDDLAAPLRILKLHGSISDAGGLVLTEADLANLEGTRPALWAALRELLSTRPLLAIGSSLRDPSIVRLLESCRPALRGWAVVYDAGLADRRRLERWGLAALDGDANGLLMALERAVDTADEAVDL